MMETLGHIIYCRHLCHVFPIPPSLVFIYVYKCVSMCAATNLAAGWDTSCLGAAIPLIKLAIVET